MTALLQLFVVLNLLGFLLCLIEILNMTFPDSTKVSTLAFSPEIGVQFFIREIYLLTMHLHNNNYIILLFYNYY